MQAQTEMQERSTPLLCCCAPSPADLGTAGLARHNLADAANKATANNFGKTA